jgi:hypothetical protein
MSNGKKTWLWTTLVVILATAGVLALLYRYRRQPLTIAGAITVQDADYRKELPIANVEVAVAGGLAPSSAKSDSTGFFSVQLFKQIRRGHPIKLEFRHPSYEPLVVTDIVGDKLYIAHMIPLARNPEPAPKKPAIVIGNVRAKYSMKAKSSVNIGSAVKTFEVVNTGNVPCLHSPICSPDHRWKAAIGSVTLDAGPGNEFHDARLSCIAGPCPFTRIKSDEFSDGGPQITASILNWSDTTTFLLEAEVTHVMDNEIGYQSYPVIFGSAFSFTLPARAEGLSLEADVAGEALIFPVGPDLLLSWATCNSGIDETKTKVYHCELKPGYRFQ